MFKKILASALAVAMLAGMSVTAFAALTEEGIMSLKEGDLIFFLHIAAEGEELERGDGWVMLDDENQVIVDDEGALIRADFENIKPGDKIATMLLRMEHDYADIETEELSFEDMIDFTISRDETRGWNLDILWDTEDPKIEMIEGVYFQTVRIPFYSETPTPTPTHMEVIK